MLSVALGSSHYGGRSGARTNACPSSWSCGCLSPDPVDHIALARRAAHGLPAHRSWWRSRRGAIPALCGLGAARRRGGLARRLLAAGRIRAGLPAARVLCGRRRPDPLRRQRPRHHRSGARRPYRPRCPATCAGRTRTHSKVAAKVQVRDVARPRAGDAAGGRWTCAISSRSPRTTDHPRRAGLRDAGRIPGQHRPDQPDQTRGQPAVPGHPGKIGRRLRDPGRLPADARGTGLQPQPRHADGRRAAPRQAGQRGTCRTRCVRDPACWPVRTSLAGESCLVVARRVPAGGRRRRNRPPETLRQKDRAGTRISGKPAGRQARSHRRSKAGRVRRPNLSGSATEGGRRVRSDVRL